jgi:secreted trypsin-like serine protease
MHPDYDGNAPGYPNDIALLHLSEPADTQGNRVTPVTIADDDFSAVAPVRWIVGWGKLDGAESGGSDILMSATTREITNSECQSRWYGVSGATINSGHLCLFDNPPGISTVCSGDNGGPVFAIGKKGELTAIGISSWGISTCSGEFPAVTTRISEFWDWINATATY